MDDVVSNSSTVITFYSYKGGTGRTMALANIACLLATDARKQTSDVLMIDWDLEAPGLHRYCQNISNSNGDTVQNGLLDYFYSLDQSFRKSRNTYTKLLQGESIDIILPIDNILIKNALPGVDLIKAGRFDSEYAGKAEAFDWVSCYNEFGEAIKYVRDSLSE